MPAKNGWEVFLSTKEFTGSDLFEVLKHVKVGPASCHYHFEKCEEIAPLINEINHLKREKNAVILAHSYVAPEIIYGVSDFNGDSYQLSKDAQNTSAQTIVFAAVKFMAETAKILNPHKKVLVPNKLNGCTLADSITGEKVRELKKNFPHHAFVCYINTSAEVKAECDVCVTSSNVYDIVQKHPNDKIFFLPDRLMGLNVIDEMNRRGVKKEIQIYDGVCYVHEQYDPEMIEFLRLEHPLVKVLAHPECTPGILAHSDYVGSTSQMIQYVKKSPDRQFVMLTECGLTGRLQMELPDRQFIGSCTMCKYMKDNSLENILRVLKNPDLEDEIHIDSGVLARAYSSIESMFKFVEN